MSPSESRPDTDQDTDQEQIADETGRHPSFGLAGKIQGAHTAAPSDATTDQVLAVAWEAFRRGVPAADVWEERHG